MPRSSENLQSFPDKYTFFVPEEARWAQIRHVKTNVGTALNKALETIIDYIVVHELCHFHHGDHTDAFWNEVDKVMPDFRERKEWLRKNGAGLDV